MDIDNLIQALKNEITDLSFEDLHRMLKESSKQGHEVNEKKSEYYTGIHYGKPLVS